MRRSIRNGKLLCTVCPGHIETLGVISGQLACVQELLKAGGATTEEQMYQVLDTIYHVSDSEFVPMGSTINHIPSHTLVPVIKGHAVLLRSFVMILHLESTIQVYRCLTRLHDLRQIGVELFSLMRKLAMCRHCKLVGCWRKCSGGCCSTLLQRCLPDS